MIENENTAQFEKPDEIENSQNHDKQMINNDNHKKDPKRKKTR